MYWFMVVGPGAVAKQLQAAGHAVFTPTLTDVLFTAKAPDNPFAEILAGMAARVCAAGWHYRNVNIQHRFDKRSENFRFAKGFFEDYAMGQWGNMFHTSLLSVDTRINESLDYSIATAFPIKEQEMIRLDGTGAQWLPWYHTRFDEGQDIAPDRAAQMVQFLASGQADRLAGAFLTSDDDLATSVQRLDAVAQRGEITASG